MNVAALLAEIDARCRERPAATALVQAGDRSLTYGEVRADLDGLTAGLLAAGMRPGDGVVYSVRPSPESVLLMLAVVRCGGVLVAADPGMSPDVFAARMALLDPRWVMAESLLYALSRARPLRSALERRGVRLPNLDVPGAGLVLQGPRLPWAPRALNYCDLARNRAAPAAPDLDPEARVVVVFTSGTTAMPKAVVHSGRSLGAGLGLVAEQLHLRPSDRVYSDQLHMIVPGLMAGAAVVIPRRRFTARRAIEDLARYRPTHAYWVPVQLQEILTRAAATGADLPDSLAVVVLASAPAGRGFLLRCAAALPPATRVYSAYAMTEMLPVSFVEATDKLSYWGTGDLVGAPCPGVQVRIAEDGEVMLSGPNLCPGYLGSRALRELATGDLGRLDGGRLVLLGRKKDMIIRGSHNIYPALIEAAVAGVPGVRRCALVGVYDERRADELVVLAFEPESGCDGQAVEAGIRREIWEGPHRIDVFARPDYIVASPLPLGGRSRKIDKAAVRELVRELIPC